MKKKELLPLCSEILKPTPLSWYKILRNDLSMKYTKRSRAHVRYVMPLFSALSNDRKREDLIVLTALALNLRAYIYGRYIHNDSI